MFHVEHWQHAFSPKIGNLDAPHCGAIASKPLPASLI